MELILFIYSKSVLLLIAVIIDSVQSYWTDFEFSGIDNAKTGCFQTDLKVGRFNKTTITINGNLSIVETFQDYDCEGKVSYSPAGNNQYKLLPFKIARDTCCNFLESFYWKATEENFFEASPDAPRRIDKELYCVTLKKGTYSLRNFVLDAQVIPKFSKPGSYRADFNLYRKQDDEKATLSFFCRLY